MEQLQGMLAALGVLLALGAALFFLRNRGFVRFNGPGLRSGGSERALQTIERLSLTPQHSLHVVRVGSRKMLIVLSPGGCQVLDAPVGDKEGATDR